MNKIGKMAPLFLMVVIFLLTGTTTYAANVTYNEDETKTGYHLEAVSSRTCDHDQETDCDYVYCDYEGLNPTSSQLIAHVKTSSSRLKLLDAYTVSANGSMGNGTVSGLRTYAKLDNVKFGTTTCYVSDPYLCPDGNSGYAYYYMYYSYCDIAETYFFVGSSHRWLGCTGGDIGNTEADKQTYTHTVTLYKFVPNTYTIKFNGNGSTSGSTASMTDLEYDTSYKLTANGFTKTGYTFTGWNTKADGSGTSYSNKESVKNLTTKDGGTVTLYAQWEANVASIRYYSNGGSISTTRTDSIYYNSSQEKYFKLTGSGLLQYSETTSDFSTYYTKMKYSATSLNLLNVGTASIKKTGYHYDADTAWLVGSADSSVTITQESTTSSTDLKKITSYIKSGDATVSLYVNWQPNTYTIKFNGNGSTSGSTSSMTDLEYDTSYKLTANGFTKTGYTFTGWNTEADGSGTTYKNKASVKNLTTKDGGTVTLYAQWTANTDTPYVVNHWLQNSDGNETTYDSSNYTLKDTEEKEGTTDTSLTLKDLKKTYAGYTYKLGQVEGTTVTKATISADGSLVVDLYYTRNTYTLTVDPNGGTWESSTAKSTFTMGYGEKKTITEPQRDGYDFTGWELSGEGSSLDGTTFQMGYEDATLTAQWAEKSYTIYYESNKPSTASSDVEGTVHETIASYNISVDLATKDGIQEAYSITGWVLTGWNTKADGSGEHFEVHESVMNPGCENAYVESVTLYAEWEPISYTIRFDGNGGSGQMEEIKAVYDQEISLTANVFTQENFKYMGWNTDINATYGEGYVVEYIDQQTVKNLATEQDAVVTLYAVWDEIPELAVVDRYFTLSDAQEGRITEAVLLETAEANDTEDGILEGEVNITLTNYAPTDFTMLEHEATVSMTYMAKDNVGNKVKASINVYIIDQSYTYEEDTVSYTRFISEEYLYTLDPTSIWVTDSDYNKLLTDTLAIERVDQTVLEKSFFGYTIQRTQANSGTLTATPEYSYTFDREGIDLVQSYISEHGLGNSKEEDALSNFMEVIEQYKNQ